jgi:hypothetical protein
MRVAKWFLLASLPSTALAQYSRPHLPVLVVETAAAAVVFAGSDQWVDSPKSWAQDGAGYRRRLDVRATQFTLAAAAEVTLFTLTNVNPGYEACERCTSRRRLTHIVSRALTVQPRQGNRTFAWQVAAASLVGASGSAPLLPSRYRATWVLTRPLTTLAARGALFSWYEFAPRALGGRRPGP